MRKAEALGGHPHNQVFEGLRDANVRLKRGRYRLVKILSKVDLDAILLKNAVEVSKTLRAVVF